MLCCFKCLFCLFLSCRCDLTDDDKYFKMLQWDGRGYDPLWIDAVQQMTGHWWSHYGSAAAACNCAALFIISERRVWTAVREGAWPAPPSERSCQLFCAPLPHSTAHGYTLRGAASATGDTVWTLLVKTAENKLHCYLDWAEKTFSPALGFKSGSVLVAVGSFHCSFSISLIQVFLVFI